MIQFKTLSFFFSIVVVLFFVSCKPTTKDEPKIVEANTVLDIDGNVYHTVTIGTQTWMVENLKTTKYRNGDLIGTTIPANKDISLDMCPQYQWAYNGDETLVSKYGRLYTWYAVDDFRNIAPAGWHVATNADWTLLESYVSTHFGTSMNIAKALASNSDWTIQSKDSTIGSNLAINNYSGFSALPAGYRYYAGTFFHLGEYGSWWSSTRDHIFSAWSFTLSYNADFVFRYSYTNSYGFSVRCVKDSL